MPTLLNLPPEVLTSIISVLVGSVNLHEGIGLSSLTSGQRRRIRDLSHLSKVCKMLQDIAQPQLFRTPFLTSYAWPRFVLALLRNPRLRHYVRRLFLIGYRVDYEVEQTDAKLVEAAIQENRTAYDATMKGLILDPKKISWFSSRMSTLLLALTAETLEALFLDNRAVPQCTFPEAFFPNLKKLGYWYGAHVVRCSSSDVGPIITSAPRLTTLRFAQLDSAHLFRRRTDIDTLTIEGSKLSLESLISILLGMPKLRKLQYSCYESWFGPEDETGYVMRPVTEFTGSELSAILADDCMKLQELEISFARTAAGIDEIGGSPSVGEAGFDFTNLHALEIVSLDGIRLTDLNELEKMLPESLQSLKIGRHSNLTAAHTFRLLDAIGKFPNLKTLDFDYQDWSLTDLQTFQSRCDKMRINCVLPVDLVVCKRSQAQPS